MGLCKASRHELLSSHFCPPPPLPVTYILVSDTRMSHTSCTYAITIHIYPNCVMYLWGIHTHAQNMYDTLYNIGYMGDESSLHRISNHAAFSYLQTTNRRCPFPPSYNIYRRRRYTDLSRHEMSSFVCSRTHVQCIPYPNDETFFQTRPFQENTFKDSHLTRSWQFLFGRYFEILVSIQLNCFIDCFRSALNCRVLDTGVRIIMHAFVAWSYIINLISNDINISSILSRSTCTHENIHVIYSSLIVGEARKTLNRSSSIRTCQVCNHNVYI